MRPPPPLPRRGDLSTDPRLDHLSSRINLSAIVMFLTCHPEERGICGGNESDCCDLLYCLQSFYSVVSTDSSFVAMTRKRKSNGRHTESLRLVAHSCITFPNVQVCDATGVRWMFCCWSPKEQVAPRSFDLLYSFLRTCCSCEVKEKASITRVTEALKYRAKARVCAQVSPPWEGRGRPLLNIACSGQTAPIHWPQRSGRWHQDFHPQCGDRNS